MRWKTLRRYHKAAGSKPQRERRGPGAARRRLLIKNVRPVRSRNGDCPEGCADIARRTAPATTTTAGGRTAPPGKSDTIGRRAAPAPITGRAVTGAASVDDDRSDGSVITPATRESARDGGRTRAICYLASEAGAVDRPRGVCFRYFCYLSTFSALLRSAVCLSTVFKRTSLSIYRHWLVVRLMGAAALLAVFFS